MEHFSRPLLLEDSGQEFTGRTRSMFRRQVDRTLFPGEMLARSPETHQGVPRGCCYGTGSLKSKWSRARDTRFRDFRSEVASRARDVVRGVPRFFNMEISMTRALKSRMSLEFFRRQKFGRVGFSIVMEREMEMELDLLGISYHNVT